MFRTAFRAMTPCPVRLSVYDVTGRRVVDVLHETLPPGTYTVSCEAGGLANGLYVFYLETPRGSRTEPMVVLR